MNLSALKAVFQRDLKLALSYKLDFIIRTFSSFFSVVLWYYLSLFLKPNSSVTGTNDYFTYVIVGMALLGYINVMLYTFSHKIRNDQLLGTLEMVVASPSRFSLIIFSSAIWEFLFETFDLLVFIIFAILFGAKFVVGSYIALILTFILTMISFGSLGIISASFLMVFKKGEPVTPFIAAFFALLGNVFFPTKILPPILNTLSLFIPLPYSATAFRKIMVDGAIFFDVLPEIQALTIFSIILLPIALISLNFSIRIARRYGLLGAY